MFLLSKTVIMEFFSTSFQVPSSSGFMERKGEERRETLGTSSRIPFPVRMCVAVLLRTVPTIVIAHTFCAS